MLADEWQVTPKYRLCRKFNSTMMEKIVTETGKKKVKIKTTGNQLELTVDRGGWYEPRRTIELSKRQVQKLIDELQSALENVV